MADGALPRIVGRFTEIDERCEHCGGPLWVPPHPQAGYRASMICDCKEVGRRDVKARIAWAKREGMWEDQSHG